MNRKQGDDPCENTGDEQLHKAMETLLKQTNRYLPPVPEFKVGDT